jgi:hypothetical protein
MFVITEPIIHSETGGMCIICLQTEFHVSDSYYRLASAMQQKATQLIDFIHATKIANILHFKNLY